MHPIQALWSRHHPTTGYPTGVLPVPQPIPGLAFFPGGYGVWGAHGNQPLPDLPVGKIMVLGHDFHSETGYQKSLAMGAERLTLPTWANLLRLFHTVGISPELCFFTNFYMGLRAGKATTGRFPGATNPIFVNFCRQFLLEQLQMQQPVLILTLGVYVPEAIAPMSEQLAPWGERRGLKHLDTVGPVQLNVRFKGLDNLTSTVVALTHPSLRAAGVRHRSYQGLTGSAAEEQMLKEGLAAAFPSLD